MEDRLVAAPGVAPRAEVQAKPADEVQEGADLATLIAWIDDAEEASYQARKQAERCRDYYDNKQLTAEERAELRRRGQPEVIRNEIRSRVNFLKGWEKQNRTDPKAFPRNIPDDEEAAESATDMLRFQEQANRLDQLLSRAWGNMIVEGFCGVEVLGVSAADKRRIEVKFWRWDRLGYDPHSSEPDFSDANYKYGVVWLDRAEAVRRWPHRKEVIEATIAEEVRSAARTYEDKPTWTAWAARSKRDRVRVVQIYYRHEGAWHWCLFCKGGKLEGGPVELLDSNGEPECPLLLQSAYIDRENNRYGEVVALLTLQDEINKRGSKALHLLNSRQIVYEQGAIIDVAAAKGELARPDGALELAPGALRDKQFEVLEHSGDVAANLQMMEAARGQIALMGPNATLQGKQQGVASGRAIRASQEGGLIELADIKDLHLDFKRRVYAAIWNRCRQLMTEEVWVRVTDSDKSVKFVGYNRQVTQLEQLVEQAEQEGIGREEALAQIEQAAQQNPAIAQQLQQVSQVNVLAETDVDIIIEASTDSVNMQEETFEQLVNLAGAGVTFPPEVYIEASPLRNKKRYLDLLKPKPEEEKRQTEAMDLEREGAVATIAKDRAKAIRDMAEAEVAGLKGGSRMGALG